MRNKKGQVWIETVLYTLIGIVLMGLVLTFALPKINASKDKILIKQTISSLLGINERIESVSRAPGNIRNVEFTMKRGELFIDGEKEEIRFVISDLTLLYSQPGVEIKEGKVSVVSEEGQKKNKVTMKMHYSQNITYQNKDENKKFSGASTPYLFSIENSGAENGNIVIDFDETSNR